MIFDRLENSSLYASLGPGISQAFLALAGDLPGLPDGRHNLDGDRIFALIQSYQTKPRSQGLWEAHRKYVDIQYLVTGREQMGFLPTANLPIKTPYEAAKDILFFDAPSTDPLPLSGGFLTAGPGDFALFFPTDAHMPSLMLARSEPVKKIVIKIAVEFTSHK